MWDCKYKFGRDRCRRRGTVCYPGGIRCVLKGKFDFPLRDEPDELDGSEKKKARKKAKK